MSSPAASGMLDRRDEYRAGASSLLPLPLPKRLTESVAEQLSKKQRRRARRAVDEAVLAISWLHSVDHLPWPVHSSNGFAAQRTSELLFEAQQRVEEAVLRWSSASLRARRCNVSSRDVEGMKRRIQFFGFPIEPCAL